MARLSTELRRNIVETLGSPVIPLFLGRNTGTEILWDYAGSGVLVEVDGEDGILTAEHVIFSDNRLRNATLLATIPRVYSVENFSDPIPDDPTIHPSGHGYRLGFWTIILPRRRGPTTNSKARNGDLILALSGYRK